MPSEFIHCVYYWPWLFIFFVFILGGKYMHSSVVTGHTQQWGVLAEVDTVKNKTEKLVVVVVVDRVVDDLI